MIYAIKKPNESGERLIARFKKVAQRARVLQDARNNRFHEDAPTKRLVRKAAIIRARHRATRERAKYYS